MPQVHTTKRLTSGGAASAYLASSEELNRFRAYLRNLAVGLGPSPDNRVDPSDVVQQTLLEAFSTRRQFRGNTRAELAQWLKRILARNIVDAGRALRRKKRDVRREKRLDACDSQNPRMNFHDLLASNQITPSKDMSNAEQVMQLTEAVRQLPEPQREAIVLHHLQGHTLAEVAKLLNRTKPAVAGLLHRGLKSLRSMLIEEDEK